MKHEEKIWMHYVKNIIAADVPSAVFLASYIKYNGLSQNYISALEVIDLQKYKVFSQPAKVQTALYKRGHLPFVFVVGKN